MATQINKEIITIPKKTIRKGIVILPLREYQKLCEMAIPTYYLKGKEAEELDKLVKEGLREYKNEKTIKAFSIRKALRIYERKQNKKR